MVDAPRFVPHEQMRKHFGAVATDKAVLIMVRGWMFKREPDGWYRLDGQPRASVKEFTDEST